MFRIAAIALTSAVVIAAPVALAATPESGEVSKAQPKVEWTGTVINSYFNRLLVLQTGDDSVPCMPESCDMFALKVAESDDLTITADAPEGESADGSVGTQVTLRIRKPDDSVSIHSSDDSGVSPEKPLVVKLKKAPAGDYEIEYFTYHVASYGPVDYKATATLGAVQPAGAAAPAPTSPGPAPAPNPTTPSSAPQQGLDVTVKTGKLSAKKLNRSRKLAAKVSVSREVKSLTATLKSGSKVVGTGRLAGFSGTKSVSLKLSKKLKKGTYALTVSATDGAGSTGAKTVKVKVAR